MGASPPCPLQLSLDLQLIPRKEPASTVFAPLHPDMPGTHAPFLPTPTQTACPASLINPKSPEAEINGFY